MTRAQRIQMRRNAQRQRRAAEQRQLQERAAQRRKNRQRRNATAYGLKGATEFSADPVLSNPVKVVELFRRWAPATALELIRATTRVREPGQAGANRMDGSWALVFLAHIICGNPDWQRWYYEWQASDLWRVCGFEETPSWGTLYDRFGELEEPRHVAAFERAANKFIRIAARNVPRAFAHVHIDGTPAHSHARLEHACPNGAYCTSRVGSKAKHIARASDDTIGDERHERSAAAEPTDPDAPPPPQHGAQSNRVIYLSDAEAEQLGLANWRKWRYLKFGPLGHIYRSRDKDAGVRSYSDEEGRSKKAWNGSYFLPAVSDYFWSPFALHFFSARDQEHLGWPTLYRKAMTALNDDPDDPQVRITAVIADRAFTNKSFIGFNTTEGVASITPERKLPGGRPWRDLRDPDGRFDEHGPRCQYCGGPSAPARGAGEGFALTGTGDPRLAYRCAIGWTQDCQKMQTISCKREVRALLPIGRRERLFHDLLASHSHTEGVFDSWRDRYAVSGTSNATRSKRRLSIPAQKLRGAAALLAEWFRICLRMGYVGNHARRNPHQPAPREGGGNRLIKLREYRSRHNLDLPIGPAATALGILPTPAANAPPPAPPP